MLLLLLLLYYIISAVYVCIRQHVALEMSNRTETMRMETSQIHNEQLNVLKASMENQLVQFLNSVDTTREMCLKLRSAVKVMI